MQLVTQPLMTPDGYLPQTQVLPQLSDTWCLETTRFAEANGKYSKTVRRVSDHSLNSGAAMPAPVLMSAVGEGGCPARQPCESAAEGPGDATWAWLPWETAAEHRAHHCLGQRTRGRHA